MAAEAASDLARAQAHLRAIGSAPRPAGSPADEAARRYAAEVLTAVGFETRDERFGYSALPGRFGTPLVGAAAVTTMASVGHLASRGFSLSALVILISGIAALALVGRWLARDGVLDAPFMRAEGTNLVAVRGARAPRLWLVAHTDSKSQPVPQALRAVGIIALGAAMLAALLLAAAQAAGRLEPSMPLWIGLTLLAGLAGIPVVLSVVGARSDGALDNASGVATVLLAAERLPREVPIGILVTTAEELGLAGARAWARGAGEGTGQIALNCDGVDDVGMLTAMYTGKRPTRVLTALRDAAGAGEYDFRAMRLVPGILVDAVALADAGWQTATLSRGTVATLARVHTIRDTLAHLEGRGIPAAAVVLATAAHRLATDGDR